MQFDSQRQLLRLHLSRAFFGFGLAVRYLLGSCFTHASHLLKAWLATQVGKDSPNHRCGRLFASLYGTRGTPYQVLITTHIRFGPSSLRTSVRVLGADDYIAPGHARGSLRPAAGCSMPGAPAQAKRGLRRSCLPGVEQLQRLRTNSGPQCVPFKRVHLKRSVF